MHGLGALALILVPILGKFGQSSNAKEFTAKAAKNAKAEVVGTGFESTYSSPPKDFVGGLAVNPKLTAHD